MLLIQQCCRFLLWSPVVEHPYNCNPSPAFCVFACRFYRTTLKLGGRWNFTGRLQAAHILLVSKMFIRTSMQGVTVCWSLWNGEFSNWGRKLEWLLTFGNGVLCFTCKVAGKLKVISLRTSQVAYQASANLRSVAWSDKDNFYFRSPPRDGMPVPCRVTPYY